jgi:hypothetical protein
MAVFFMLAVTDPFGYLVVCPSLINISRIKKEF